MILAWAPSRPLWQQDALKRIVANGKLDPCDIDALVQLCLRGQGKKDVALEPVPLSSADRLVRVTAGGALSLRSISNVTRANRLAPEQTLPFEPAGLTVIYGDNGVGKSGYARILKRACRARFSAAILPDAFAPAEAGPASATICWADEGVECPPIEWSDEGAPHPVLCAISVFDRDSAAVHVRDQNEVAFRPFGLDIPDELAAACQAVKEKLSQEQERLSRAQDQIFTRPPYSTQSCVGRIMSSLTADSDLEALRVLATMSAQELERLERLSEDLAGDPLKAATAERTWASSLERFATELDVTLARTSEVAVSALMEAVVDAQDKRKAAQLAAGAAFGAAVVRGVGEAPWRALWDAARRYSQESAYPDKAFPVVDADAACLLCQQPIDPATRIRLTSFEAFVTDDIERQAQQAEKRRDTLVGALAASPVRLTAFPLVGQLAIRVPDVWKTVLRSLAASRVRRSRALTLLSDQDIAKLPHPTSSPVDVLRGLAARARHYADELTRAADPQERARLESARDELRDRKSLRDLLPKAEAEIARLRELACIHRSLAETDTKSVTRLGNAIADEVITPRVRDRFQEEIQKLAAGRVRVDIVRSGGRFGSPQYQVRLFANEKAKVHSILSEGEQTCVALAAFLTELTTADRPSALVFDDPVSSLDHRWRQKVAERLIEEARTRQIIVFTHDLVFLSDLQTLASRGGIPHKEVSLSQSARGAGVVREGLPWVGQRIPERLDNLEKEARAARILYENHDEDGYAAAVATFYNHLRSTWERALEDVAFCNVVHRHRDYINPKDLKKVVVLEGADIAGWERGYKVCCDITDAHDPSRGRNAACPPPDDLLAHVADLTEWTRSLRDRQKLVA
ncbi:AAA family ATPase [Sphingomonas kaistensis]|uniref:AAA family ATPase n=1 Tax=Sphingomonas kaistensis TaxID=298708 RepID=A0ABZ2G154_9SPHN